METVAGFKDQTVWLPTWHVLVRRSALMVTDPSEIHLVPVFAVERKWKHSKSKRVYRYTKIAAGVEMTFSSFEECTLCCTPYLVLRTLHLYVLYVFDCFVQLFFVFLVR